MTEPRYTHHDDTPTPTCVLCQGRPVSRGSRMCGGCFVRLRSDLDVLAFAHTTLGADMAALHTGARGSIGHEAAGPRLPFAAGQHDTRVDIEGKIASWARTVAELHEPAIPGPGDPAIREIVRWLANLLPWVSCQDWCDEMAEELGEAAIKARRLVPWEPRHRRLPGPCPNCKRLSLIVFDGDALILCRIRDCGRRLTWDQYWGSVTTLYHGPVFKPSTSNGAAA